MKVDVVIAYYRQPQFWPLVSWGLQQNAAHIHSVILVNDEPWTWAPTLDRMPLVLLDHPHDGFGMTRSYNQGAHAAATDMILFSQGDLVLEPFFLEKALASVQGKYLVYNWVNYIAPPTHIEDLEAPNIIDGDWRSSQKVLDGMLFKRRMYYLGKGASFLAHREKYLALGGFDEEFAHLGPNSEDHDFAARWIMEYGEDSVRIGGGATAWHIGDPPQDRRDNFVMRMPSYESRARLATTLGRYFKHRYTLWGATSEAAHSHRFDRCIVGHITDRGCDVRVDCLQLEWMPDGSAQSIEAELPTTYLPQTQIEMHLEVVARKLAPGGELILTFPERIPWTTLRLTKRLVELGLEIEECLIGEITAVRGD